MTENALTLGELLRLYRKRNNITVDIFLESLGSEHAISPAYVTKLEVHDELPSDELAYKIAKLIGISRDDIIKIIIRARVKRFEKSLIKRYDVAISLKIEGLDDAFL